MTHHALRSIALAAIALAAASACARSGQTSHTPQSAATTATSGEQPLPSPIAVCVAGDGGPARWGMATPSRAGTYDPHAPVDPTLLNWMVPGVFACVQHPATDRPRAQCDPAHPPAPVVSQVLCGQ